MERIASLEYLNKQLSKSPHRHKVIISDSNTTEYCLTHLIYSVEELSNAQIIEIEAGESSKNLETYASVIEALLEQGADRNTFIIALGGGVVCDLANFVASTYKRGVSCILIPTTTLAMVDAAIGGKCGLDIGNVKNQIGTFNKAETICIDTTFLETLEEARSNLQTYTVDKQNQTEVLHEGQRGGGAGQAEVSCQNTGEKYKGYSQ